MSEEITIPVDGKKIHADLEIPDKATGIVLFVHGSGSSRFSKRNQHVAKLFREEGMATLLIDLLTPEEEEEDLKTRLIRFDIPMLATRVVKAIDWLKTDERTASLLVGLIGSSTGAAAALIAATDRPNEIRAVVSRGGRPDLAGAVLPRVKAPTLLVVGGNDTAVIELNKQALDLLSTERQLEIIPGATHLFEEAGTLEQAAKLASHFLHHHLKHS